LNPLSFNLYSGFSKYIKTFIDDKQHKFTNHDVEHGFNFNLTKYTHYQIAHERSAMPKHTDECIYPKQSLNLYALKFVRHTWLKLIKCKLKS